MTGAGPPLILVGGGLTGWASWEAHAERLARTRRTIRPQLQSVRYGLENRDLPSGYSIRTESRALGAALEAQDLPRELDLVAWSFGALVTLDLALAAPRRVRTLTLIEPPALWVLDDRGAGDPAVQRLGHLFPQGLAEISEEVLAEWAVLVGLCPPGLTPHQLPHWPSWLMHRRSLRSTPAVLEHRDDPVRLRRLTFPVLLVSGTGTSPVLRRVHETLLEKLPDARAMELPAGHAPHIVTMERFLEELAGFQDHPPD